MYWECRRRGGLYFPCGGTPLPNEPAQYNCVNLPKTNDNDIEHMKMMHMPYLDIWSMLLSG